MKANLGSVLGDLSETGFGGQNDNQGSRIAQQPISPNGNHTGGLRTTKRPPHERPLSKKL